MTNKEITRRNFLEKSLAVGAGLFLTNLNCKSYDYRNLFPWRNKIKDFVESFPDENVLPGTRSVRKFYIPGSKHCLVHIRQRHYEYGVETCKVALDEWCSIQREIYQILEFLIKEKGLKHVYPEGLLVGERKESIKERAREYYEKMKKRTGREYMGGAVKKLIIEGKIDAKPSELYETREKIQKIRGDGLITVEETPEYNRLKEQKEDDLFQLIVDNKDEIAYAVFGAMHAWGGEKSCGKGYNNRRKMESYKDNLDEWNRKYRDEKFSSIEVTPYHYWYDKKMEW